MSDIRPLALTSGDPSGIGLEIAFKAWLSRKKYDVPPFILFANELVVKKRAAFLNLDIPICKWDPSEQPFLSSEKFFIFPLENEQTDTIGRPNIKNTSAILESIEKALTFIKNKKCLALVTNPISKKILHDGGFSYPGHTEFLAVYAEKLYNLKKVNPVMMIAAPDLRVVPLTIHIPLKDVAPQIKKETIIQKTRIIYKSLLEDFKFLNPRIAISGLNPHAGESGILGTEELTEIEPAITKLRKELFNIMGPYSADTLFHEKKRKNYDCILCMYHDQALIPIKTLYFDQAVNVTLGLPFIRTSPDHGTAFEIAHTGCANPSSLISALKLADRLATNRKHLS